MKYLLMLLWSLWALMAGAADLALIPPANSLLVDQAEALSRDQAVLLEGRLKRIQEGGQAQVAVLVSKGSPGEALAAYSLRVAEAWKLGRAGRDDGLLIVLLPASHTLRLEVGYGLEGLIPDALAARWIGESLPLLKTDGAAVALSYLLDQVESVLPHLAPKADDNYLFPDHPEWRLPFLLAFLSPFAVFPLFFGPWAALASAPILAGLLGRAAWLLWGLSSRTWAVGGVALLLPFLWSLFHLGEKRIRRLPEINDPDGAGFSFPCKARQPAHGEPCNGGRNAAGERKGKSAGIFIDRSCLSPWQRRGRVLAAVSAGCAMAGWIMLFIGTVLSAVGPDYFWVAPLFATLFGLGLGGGLLPEGATRQVLMLVWRSYFHFIFALIFVYLALLPLTPHPGPLAATVAGVFTLLVALSLYADSQKGPVAKRWSHRLTGLTLLIVLPVGLWLLVLAVVGGSLAQGAAGGGAIGGVLWWALKNGFLAAASVGLGGRFGGGGASGGE